MYSVILSNRSPQKTKIEQAALPRESYESGKAYTGGWPLDVEARISLPEPWPTGKIGRKGKFLCAHWRFLLTHF